MYCIGLTGSIASGKSTVATMFAELGVPIISADHIAKDLTKPGKPAFLKIIDHFGKEITSSEGNLNRPLLRDIIFKNIDDRLWLEELLHPLIRTNIEQEIKQLSSGYCLIEIPLLTNLLDYPYLNRVLLVLSDYESKIQRIMSRDKCSKQQAIAILKSQPSETRYKELADDIVINNCSLNQLKKRVSELNTEYSKASF